MPEKPKISELKKLLSIGLTSVLVASASLVTVAQREANATPQLAQKTGKPCGFCHTKPPALNAEGKKFKANGHKL
jgi:hypothetical protein